GHTTPRMPRLRFANIGPVAKPTSAALALYRSAGSEVSATGMAMPPHRRPGSADRRPLFVVGVVSARGLPRGYGQLDGGLFDASLGGGRIGAVEAALPAKRPQRGQHHHDCGVLHLGLPRSLLGSITSRPHNEEDKDAVTDALLYSILI